MTKPTVDEIAAYCAERKNGINAQTFFDHHERVGWVVGKNKTPMKNWQATVRTWEKTRNGVQDDAKRELRQALLKHDMMPEMSAEAKGLFYSKKMHWSALRKMVMEGRDI